MMEKWNKEKWTQDNYADLVDYLKEVGDEKSAAFTRKLVYADLDTFGVRIPVLRKLAKEISKGNWREYLNLKKNLKNQEEVLLEGLVIANLKVDYEDAAMLIWGFSRKIFNWAICDTFVDKRLLAPYKERFWREELDKYLFPGELWRQRVGILIMMTLYLEGPEISGVFEKIKMIKSEEYYVEMAIAWLLATAIVKNREKTLNFLKESSDELPKNVRKMAAQKMRDSRQVSQEDKVLVTKILAKS